MRTPNRCNTAVQRIAASVFVEPVVIPTPGEYVADGAARQAAWALAGSAEPPSWGAAGEVALDPAPVPAVRAAYAEAFAEVHGRT